ncbi:hypothetical protein [Desulfovibrio sp. Huiquan2017]|uniref:hypothetical protein n=1 Tax=Desulfovibrio sp. Huiquan2017 TaxID=2816861 RepID=UPI001A912E33|nr:hypothetical protein [Desulfovibrio sp. Huiquan2017]
MCAAITVALLPLAVFAALTVLRLSAPSPTPPNARFLAGLLDSLDRDPAAAVRHFAPSATPPVHAGRAETA